MFAAAAAALYFLFVTVVNALYLRGSRRVAVSDGGPKVSVVLPVRNEERNVAACLDGLLGQSYRDYEIIVVDDNSEDRTPEILADYAARHPSLRIIKGAPLPSGWNGKQFACRQGVAAASGELLFMTDADVRHGRRSIAFAVSALRARGASFLSGYIRQEIGSAGEALIVPMTYIMTSLLIPLPVLTSRFFSAWGFAIGQYMLAERTALEDSGGYEGIKDSLVEDMAMARAIKQGGYKTIFVDAPDYASCRMYDGYRDAFRGFAKSVFGAVGGKALVIGMLGAMIAGLIVLPFTVYLRDVLFLGFEAAGSPLPVLLFLFVWTLTLTDRGIKPLYALFYPVAFANIVVIAVYSMIRTGFGAGVEWKGRLVRCGRPDLPDPEILNAVTFFRILSFVVYTLVFAVVIVYNRLVFGLRVRGRENLRGIEGGFFLISNHSLYLDPAIVAHAVFPRKAYFSAMEETFERPFIGRFIRLLGAFPLPRVSCIRRITPAIEWALNHGKCVHFFPEGGLSHYSRDPAEFNEGVFYLADRFSVPVVPVTLVVKEFSILGVVLPKPWIRVTVVIDPPLRPEEFREGARNGRRETVREMAREARTRVARTISDESRMRTARH